MTPHERAEKIFRGLPAYPSSPTTKKEVCEWQEHSNEFIAAEIVSAIEESWETDVRPMLRLEKERSFEAGKDQSFEEANERGAHAEMNGHRRGFLDGKAEAFEEAAKIAEETSCEDHGGECVYSDCHDILAKLIRARAKAVPQ